MIEDIKDIEVTGEMIKAYNEYWQQFDEEELLNDQELVDLAGKVALEEAIQVSTQIQDLIAENKRLREENEWRLIETAPKDGEGIILTNGKSVVYGHYDDDVNEWLYYDLPDNFHVHYYNPTHWRPLSQLLRS